MLCEEVACGGMYGARKERREQKVEHDLGAKPSYHDAIESELDHPVSSYPPVLWYKLRLCQHGAERVCKDLAEHEHRLPEGVIDFAHCGVRDEVALPL
eukprot:CAMPEP_0172665208 /NCGR_PEP_ID=MMETSP1074-20121228/7099_1 /TAXON_ID=2916 /ORGANISM="Ceratium fusus, Strain PA161109" /LENGTH=97 /DNA_ID=CAMNT_0013481481 /DNA_START=319 /DNA_END=612 /DNA_ORIENTATION=+